MALKFFDGYPLILNRHIHRRKKKLTNTLALIDEITSFKSIFSEWWWTIKPAFDWIPLISDAFPPKPYYKRAIKKNAQKAWLWLIICLDWGGQYWSKIPGITWTSLSNKISQLRVTLCWKIFTGKKNFYLSMRFPRKRTSHSVRYMLFLLLVQTVPAMPIQVDVS